MSIVAYGESTDPVVHTAFLNRRVNDKFLTHVYPAGYQPQRESKPPKYKHFSEKWASDGSKVREFVEVVVRPHTTQQRARSPASPSRAGKREIDEFRNVAGPYFKQLDIDDSILFPAPASVVNLESNSIQSLVFFS
jgi:hypothetical protein